MAALASCSDDVPNPDSQKYPEPDGVFETSGLVLTQASNTLNLVNDNQANQNTVLAQIAELVNFPENYELRVDVEVSGTEDFAQKSVFTAEMSDSLVTVNPDILNGAIQEAISKKPGTYDVYTRLLAFAVRNNTVMELGGIDHSFANFKYSITTLEPTKVIEENYYLVGSFCDWDIKKALKMTNTVGGANQYDNPIFAVKFDVAAGGCKWMVIPESTYVSGNYADAAYGVVPDESGTGGVLRATNAQGVDAGVIDSEGPRVISINLSDDTYTISYAFEQLYAFTSAKNAWTLNTTDYFNYTGVAQLTTQANIAQEAALTGVIIFNQSKDSEPVILPDSISSGNLVGSLNGADGDRLVLPMKGKMFYWVEVNFVNMTYKFSAIRTLRVVGSGNDWNEKEGAQLTPSSDYKIWTAKGVKIGTEFKLNANEAWTLNFGGGQPEGSVTENGTTYTLQFNAGNMNSTPGTYDVEVNFGVYPYTVTLK